MYAEGINSKSECIAAVDMYRRWNLNAGHCNYEYNVQVINKDKRWHLDVYPGYGGIIRM